MFAPQRLLPFDATKKSGWLEADFLAFGYTTIAVALVLLGIVGGSYLIVTSLAQHVQFWLLVGVSAVAAFIIVFCLRKNMLVIGEPRKIRYICRWL